MPRWVWIATGVAAALLLLGVILYVSTNYGYVKIELSDATAQVDLKLDGTIDITGLDRPLRVRAGEHYIDVTGDNFETKCEYFSVKRGEEDLVRISLVPKSTVEVASKQPSAEPPVVDPASDEPSPPPKTATEHISEAAPKKPIEDTPPLAIAPFDAEQANQHQDVWAKHLGVPVEITNSTGGKLVLIPPGEFLMGSKVLDPDAEDRELPQHCVRITKPFYLGTCEVTLRQFRQFFEDAGYTQGADKWRKQFRDKDKSDDLPVADVSSLDATEFCKWLSAKEGKTYRLPTEAEWEYACRAGTQTSFSFGLGEGALGQYAWYGRNAGGATHPVGQKKPNPWGLYDMHGSVYEWCQDWADEDYYDQFKSEVAVDPAGPEHGACRMFPGGPWFEVGLGWRAASRSLHRPGHRSLFLGFRFR